jgi:hypothetical protein
MDIQEIEVSIDKNGQVQLHVRGMQGETCLALTADLEQALGQVLSREMTPEAGQPLQNPLTNPLNLKQG